MSKGKENTNTAAGKAEQKQNGQQPALVRQGPTYSERFLAEVEKQFLAEMGEGVNFTALEKRLVQHTYLAVDQALKTAEADRVKKNKEVAEYTWHNVDRQQLALDTVHRVSLGLDALMPGHLWPIARWSSAKALYEVDLMVGYIGRDYVTRRFAAEPPIDIVYQLVFSTDKFIALPKSTSREVEGYEFEITSPFDRGEIVGGFGYVVYEDPRKNRLILVTQRDFKRSKAASPSNFWANNDVEMHLKTIYHRVADKLPLDPTKVNAAAVAALMTEDRDPVSSAQADVTADARAHANGQVLTLDSKHSAETIDVEATSTAVEPEPEPVPAGRPAKNDTTLFSPEDAPF